MVSAATLPIIPPGVYNGNSNSAPTRHGHHQQLITKQSSTCARTLSREANAPRCRRRGDKGLHHEYPPTNCRANLKPTPPRHHLTREDMKPRPPQRDQNQLKTRFYGQQGRRRFHPRQSRAPQGWSSVPRGGVSAYWSALLLNVGVVSAILRECSLLATRSAWRHYDDLASS